MLARKKKSTSINLLIAPSVDATFSEQLLSWTLTYGRYILIITQIVVLSVFFLRFSLDREHADLKEQASEKQAILESLNDLENEIRRVQNRLTNIKTVSDKQDLPTKTLVFFQENMPSDVFFSSLSISYEKISFNATAKNLLSFSSLLAKLQQDKKFSEVVLENIQRKADGRVEFNITTRVNLSQFI